MLLYGGEASKITRSEEKILDTLQQRWPRRILGVSWQHKMTNEEVKVRASMNDIHDVVRRRWNWIGHMLHMDHTVDVVTAL